MSKILVLYYSAYGHIEKMAEAVAEGARAVPGAQVTIKRVPELVPDDVAKKSGLKLDQRAPIAKPDELGDYDADLFGTPTRFGNMCAQMRNFLDQTGGLWMKGALIGTVGRVFASNPAWRTGVDHPLVPHHAAASGLRRRRPALFLPRADAAGRDHRRHALRRHDDRRRRRLAPAKRERTRRRPLPGQACRPDHGQAHAYALSCTPDSVPSPARGRGLG